MEVYQQSGWWIVRVDGERFKFSTEKEQLEFVAGLESNNGYEEEEDYEEAFYGKEEDSSSTFGIGEEDVESESEEE
jgi:hypothetical protein